MLLISNTVVTEILNPKSLHIIHKSIIISVIVLSIDSNLPF